MKAGTYNLKLFGTFAETNAVAEYPFTIVITDPCTTPTPVIDTPTLPSTVLEYYIKTDSPLDATLSSTPFGVTPAFCPVEFTVSVSPDLSDSYWSFNEDTQVFNLEITDSVVPAGTIAPY